MEGCWIALTNPTATEIFEISEQFGIEVDDLRAPLAKVLEEVEKEGRYAVVLASRPYQNDALVNHSLPELLTEFGVPVLTADSVPYM